MQTFRTWLLSLGGTGATANAASVLEARRRDEWIVDSVVLRLDRRAAASARQPTTTAAPRIQAAG
jgi:hypothetical protein